MLKHVQLSPSRSRDRSGLGSRGLGSGGLGSGGCSGGDNVSLRSLSSCCSLSLSPELSISPPLFSHSRCSSFSSLSETPSSSSSSSSSSSGSIVQEPPTTTVKVYARCLRPDIEYKTLGITFQTTCREVVEALLSKYRMRHRDPNLFFLTMEVTVRRAGVRTMLVLDEEARPAALQACHPTGDSRFALQTRRGGLVKIYDSAVMPGSQYKSLLISERTTVDELLQILLNCYNSKERVEQFSLYEVNSSQEYQRKLHPDDHPLRVQQAWLPQHQLHFLVRRNTDYRIRRGKQTPWSPELASIPSSTPLNSRGMLPLSSTAPSTSSPFADYENYFYI